MSWSASTNNNAIDRKDIWAEGSIKEFPQTNPEGVTAAYEQHLIAAREAANALAYALGRPDDLVAISMSGHANPDHAPTPGWSDEFITVTVYARPVADSPTE